MQLDNQACLNPLSSLGLVESSQLPSLTDPKSIFHIDHIFLVNPQFCFVTHILEFPAVYFLLKNNFEE